MNLSVRSCHSFSCSFEGPDNNRSSTYTVSRSLVLRNQKDDGWFATGDPPQRSMASVKCFSQCAPDAGCPYSDFTSLQTGR
eukprot:6507519-Karenia_brevis.AAC.1